MTQRPLDFEKDFRTFDPDTAYVFAVEHNSEILTKLGIDPELTDDTVFGAKFVYCGSHSAVHSTGWCTVPVAAKCPLNSDTKEEALAEAFRRGLS